MISKSTNKSKIISLVSIVVAVTILAVTVFASGVLRNETQGQEALNSEITTFDVDESANNKTNVLISSVDGSQMRADTIMLISLEHINKSLAVLSIPRDTLIITNQNDNKISTLMTEDGNDQKIIDAVRNNLAIPVHYYARMNFEGLRNIVDILGGVEFDVPMRMLYEDPAQDLHIDLEKGRQLLDGAKAESLLRYRSGYTDGDLIRTKVQQDFMIELLKQKLNMKYLSKTSQLYHEISKNLITNYPLSKFAEDVKTLNDMNFEDVKTFTMPGKPEIRNRLFYYIIHATELEKLTEQYFSVQ